jgi:hypothetical protein
LVSWPALLAADELPQDGALNGKADDFVTGGIVTLLIVGLLAAGWLRPMWAVLVAILAVGVAVPILYELVRPTVCPAGVSGMDCIPGSFSAIAALPGLLLVLAGAGVRRVAGLRKVPLLPS